jgi:hypothetical protein
MTRSPRFAGPSLVLLIVVHIVLFAANMVAGAALRHGAFFVNPQAGSETVRAFFAENPAAVRVSGFFIFASAVPFGILTATAVMRLRFLGVRAAGSYIALFGGFSAAGALALCGLFSWVLSLPDVTASASLVRALSYLSFLFGGVTFAVGVGLLISGIAVTCHFMRLLPRWLTISGVVIAAAGELSSLSLVWYPANFFIPVSRYLGLIWLLIAAVKLSKAAQPKGVTAMIA